MIKQLKILVRDGEYAQPFLLYNPASEPLALVTRTSRDIKILGLCTQDVIRAFINKTIVRAINKYHKCMQQRFEHVGVKGFFCKGAGYEGF